MKTAVSIPDDLFVSAEKTAKKLGIPRSQLFALALEEFIQNHSNESITDSLNKVYTKSTKETETLASSLSVATLRRSLKNDTW
ncbi:ChpI protein [Leptospira biflexa serovar Patoc strain 'Patoc 1 (Ames)']|jgi:metal-responsive CopG/Arc/MetJ family transcriptional regulator|uniref:Antitoxin protein ChpI n=1 Tax=Leptospira biflexa serovar Patoc (strain Patoc 1 / ATCC 23582 / Paris) TaxID=456481 RepID=B0SPM7_LEPBP|nr:hypothetical protein [Leptospira biflexa]ABZ95431.1 ChpI protein [Leptospira biflexa serovar Patoc strain 'Patoc 1 (Ames)']ABZ99133.1 Antitoxin protein ChpI [Leptospira biflexa serovar Patoc strain 'Patoc 1 (Paris)']